MKKKRLLPLLFGALAMALLVFSCTDDDISSSSTYDFAPERVGVCSWSWKTDMASILQNMQEMNITGIQLATTPWVAGNLSDAQKEIFGNDESMEVLDEIKRLSASGAIHIMSTMICFPHEDYTSLETIENTSGFLFTTDALGHDADEEWKTNSRLVEQAARLTAELGAKYLSTEVGFVKKDWKKALERVKYACDVCEKRGVLFLIESGQESGQDMKLFIEDLEKTYPGTKIGVNFDPANHLLYGTDTPNHAFDIILPWIKQVHVKDAFADAKKRSCWSEDVRWGTGDVSQTYHFLQHVYDSGYTGNLLVEHECGNERAADIKAALKSVLNP